MEKQRFTSCNNFLSEFWFIWSKCLCLFPSTSHCGLICTSCILSLKSEADTEGWTSEIKNLITRVVICFSSYATIWLKSGVTPSYISSSHINLNKTTLLENYRYDGNDDTFARAAFMLSVFHSLWFLAFNVVRIKHRTGRRRFSTRETLSLFLWHALEQLTESYQFTVLLIKARHWWCHFKRQEAKP